MLLTPPNILQKPRAMYIAEHKEVVKRKNAIFLHNLDVYRRFMGISLTELAPKLNSDAQRLSAVLRGNLHPYAHEIKGLADLLGVSIEQIQRNKMKLKLNWK